jgi:pyruvate,water dikinase
MTACLGKTGDWVYGTVRIVNTPADMKNMTKGDILVSAATTPDILPAMKLAGAIVTDQGGITCHAAIVSRELNLPCLIGTKYATKIFKDGDKVIVCPRHAYIKFQ